MNLKTYIKIYYLYWRLGFKQSTMYRTDTIMLFLGVVVALSLNIIFFKYVFDIQKVIGGWTFAETTLLGGIFWLNWGFLKILYGRKMEETISKINDGYFDYNLLKPINLKFYSYFLGIMFKGVPNIFLSFALISYGLNNLDTKISFFGFLLLIIYMIAGHVIAFALQQACVAAAFFITDRELADDAYAIVEDGYMNARFPKEVFSEKAHVFLTYILPITTFAATPTAILLGKYQFTFFTFATPFLIASVFLFLSNKLFSYGILKYTSATS